MTKPSPWKSDRKVHVPPEGEFRFQIGTHEVLRVIEMLKLMTPSVERGFYILVAAMIHMAEINNVSKEELAEMIAKEILTHKVKKL